MNKISFTSVSLSSIELQLEFGSASKKIHFVRLAIFLNMNQFFG